MFGSRGELLEGLDEIEAALDLVIEHLGADSEEADETLAAVLARLPSCSFLEDLASRDARAVVRREDWTKVARLLSRDLNEHVRMLVNVRAALAKYRAGGAR